MQFDQFKPSKRILEQICKDEERVSSFYIVLPRIESSTKKLRGAIEDALIMANYGLTCSIAEYYRWALDMNKNMDSHDLMQLIHEQLQNALAHGSKVGGVVTLGVFVGADGVCLGFKDQGDYFKSEETKRLFESKIIPEQKGERSHLSGAHAGVFLTYKSADFIEVDTDQGVLYCIKLKKNMAKNKECMDYRKYRENE